MRSKESIVQEFVLKGAGELAFSDTAGRIVDEARFGMIPVEQAAFTDRMWLTAHAPLPATGDNWAPEDAADWAIAWANAVLRRLKR